MFVLSPKAYDFLKKLVQLVLPGIATLYLSLAGIWGLGYGEQVAGTLAALATFLGIVIGISSRTYEALGKGYDGEMIVTEGEDGASIRLALNEDTDALSAKDSIRFKRVVQTEDRPLRAEG